MEQIGYAPRACLERTVKRTAEVTLEPRRHQDRAVAVGHAGRESIRTVDGAARLAELLQQRSGSSASHAQRSARAVDDALADRFRYRLVTAIIGTARPHQPFRHTGGAPILGLPVAYIPPEPSSSPPAPDRRETGTHYTPKSLYRSHIVAETLTPIAYVGPAQGTSRADW